MLSKNLKAIRHGLKGLDVAQRFLHFPCPDLRAGSRRALSVLSVDDIEASGKRCLSGHEQSEMKVIILDGILCPSCCLGFC